MNKKILLALAISLPLIFLGALAALTYLPRIWIQPKYNYVYAVSNDYDSERLYQLTVEQNRLQARDLCRDDVSTTSGAPSADAFPNRDIYLREVCSKPNAGYQFYLHNVTTNRSQQLTLQQAQELKLDPINKSLDNFEFNMGNTSGGNFLFYSGDYSTDYYLTNSLVSIKQDIQLNRSSRSSYAQVKFLGWVI